MKLIKDNIEVVVMLVIILFIFITLVTFYEEKLNVSNMCNWSSEESYTETEEGKIEFEFIALELVTSEYVKIKDENNIVYVLKLPSASSYIIEGEKYKLSADKNNTCKTYNHKNIQNLLQMTGYQVTKED